MPTTYSDLLRFTEQGTGTNQNTWGQVLNDQFELIEQAITGSATITLASNDYTLSQLSGLEDESRKFNLDIVGNPSKTLNVIVPAVEHTYRVNNQCTGAHNAVRIKTATGQAVTVPGGNAIMVWCDGQDVFESILFDGKGLREIIFDVSHPVGSLYFDVRTNNNPNVTLGFGSWARYGSGRVLVSRDPGDADFNVLGETRGAKSVTLTVGQMPRHRFSGSTAAAGNHAHTYYRYGKSGVGWSHAGPAGSDTYYMGNYATSTGAAGNHVHSFTTAYQGSNQAHDNIQPSIVANVWQRTA